MMPLIRAFLAFAGVAEAVDSLVLPAEVGQQLEQTGPLRGDAALNSTLELASAGCNQCCQTGMCNMAYAGQMGTCCSSQTYGSYSCCPLQNAGTPYQCQATGYQQFGCAPVSGGYNGGGYNGGGYNGGGYNGGSNWMNLQHGNFDQCYREEQYSCRTGFTDLCCDSNWMCRRNSQGLHCSAYAQEDNYQTLWDYCCPGSYFEDFDLSEEQQSNKKIRSSSSEPATRADALAAFAVAMFMSAAVFAIYTNRSKKSATSTEALLA